MKISGWGKFPIIDANIILPADQQSLRRAISHTFNGIVRGKGRSYGDSALSEQTISSGVLNHFLDFDTESGEITCQAGVTLADIIEICVPKGWFLPVTPGTKFVSVGGAIASDVHGKNHHHDGCFSQHVKEISLMLPSGEIIECSHKHNTEIFQATCGGMGLTGIIFQATIKLKPIQSTLINETTIKAQNLSEILELFDEYKDAPYSVAWVDSLATETKLGRSLLIVGDHSGNGSFEQFKKKSLSIPIEMPSIILNQFSVKAFNYLYFNRIKNRRVNRVVHFEPFFYPLDSIHNWNRMYGKKGFVQYQMVLPREEGKIGLEKIMKKIAHSKKASFLTVLKLLGEKNSNYLSFPAEGYTLAMDFPIHSNIWKFLDELDELVLQHGGRIYLTKDSRMSEKVFKQSYPQWEKFCEIRQQINADKVFNSLQSNRLGI
jgi:FAD/FMN-containing dehydrogenase